MNIADVHTKLYELAAELHDGPDASKADDIRAFADTLAPDANMVIDEVQEGANPTTDNSDPARKGTSARGDSGNTTASR
jgi:hypothetical protein